MTRCVTKGTSMTKMAFCIPAGMALVGSAVAASAGSDDSSVSQVTITYLANEVARNVRFQNINVIP